MNMDDIDYKDYLVAGVYSVELYQLGKQPEYRVILAGNVNQVIHSDKSSDTECALAPKVMLSNSDISEDELSLMSRDDDALLLRLALTVSRLPYVVKQSEEGAIVIPDNKGEALLFDGENVKIFNSYTDIGTDIPPIFETKSSSSPNDIHLIEGGGLAFGLGISSSLVYRFDVERDEVTGLKRQQDMLIVDGPINKNTVGSNRHFSLAADYQDRDIVLNDVLKGFYNRILGSAAVDNNTLYLPGTGFIVTAETDSTLDNSRVGYVGFISERSVASLELDLQFYIENHFPSFSIKSPFIALRNPYDESFQALALALKEDLVIDGAKTKAQLVISNKKGEQIHLDIPLADFIAVMNRDKKASYFSSTSTELSAISEEFLQGESLEFLMEDDGLPLEIQSAISSINRQFEFSYNDYSSVSPS